MLKWYRIENIKQKVTDVKKNLKEWRMCAVLQSLKIRFMNIDTKYGKNGIGLDKSKYGRKQSLEMNRLKALARLLLEEHNLIFCASITEIYRKLFSGTKPSLEAERWEKNGYKFSYFLGLSLKQMIIYLERKLIALFYFITGQNSGYTYILY